LSLCCVHAAAIRCVVGPRHWRAGLGPIVITALDRWVISSLTFSELTVAASCSLCFGFHSFVACFGLVVHTLVARAFYLGLPLTEKPLVLMHLLLVFLKTVAGLVRDPFTCERWALLPLLLGLCVSPSNKSRSQTPSALDPNVHNTASDAHQLVLGSLMHAWQTAVTEVSGSCFSSCHCCLIGAAQCLVVCST
jgi:hypothetical protein